MQVSNWKFSSVGVPHTIASPFDERLLSPSKAFRIALLIPMCGSAGLWAPSCIACAQVAVDELNKADGTLASFNAGSTHIRIGTNIFGKRI